jgi:hypothetical protein
VWTGKPMTGLGLQAAVGAQCEISYSVFRLSSGAYFKNSSGGELICTCSAHHCRLRQHQLLWLTAFW